VGTHVVKVDARSLLESAETMKMQLDLLHNRPKTPALPTVDQAIRELVVGATDGVIEALAVDGDKLVMKDQLVPYATGSMPSGKNGIKILTGK
jgi:hypothetical protein